MATPRVHATVGGGSTVQRARPVQMSLVRSSPLGANMVGKSRNMSADMLFMPGLLALIPDHLLCEVAVCLHLVTEIRRSRCGTGAVWLRALALGTLSLAQPAP